MGRKDDCGGTVVIRPAVAKDVKHVAVLCGQLGYPSTPEQVRRRLDQMAQVWDNAIYVAERASGRVAGWVQVYVRRLLVVEQHAEIGGLVVAEGQQGCGVGRLLMEQAEDWAQDRGCESVYVRSNALRERAHRFYQAIGYEQIKTSRLFLKEL